MMLRVQRLRVKGQLATSNSITLKPYSNVAIFGVRICPGDVSRSLQLGNKSIHARNFQKHIYTK